LLKNTASIAPRSVYVSGNSTTNSGMTVTLNRDSANQGDYSLEAGALVLSDQGVCLIDELDKMTAQHASLLEAMEQQRISLAKAGIVCTLPARSSIIAACNPVSGHYNRDLSVSENIRMVPALLSRFDLIFLMLDKKNGAHDRHLSRHIMDLHSGPKKKSSKFESSQSLSDNELLIYEQIVSDEDQESSEIIDTHKFKKFIEYTKTLEDPKLSPEACQEVKSYYLKMRKLSSSEFACPITTRFLESIIRLSKARAKISHKKIVSIDHVRLVIALISESIDSIFKDSKGKDDFSRSQQSSGMSARSKWKRYIAHLTNRAEIQNKKLFSYNELLEVAQSAKVDTFDFKNFIDTLNTQGFILKKGNNLYQIQTI
ncbi:MAG: DNA replication licensing factor mcm8, partial [Marteilia pararefringens]